MNNITHVNKDNKPQMVDVSKKKITSRSAHAQSIVVFPEEVISRFVNGDISSAKGPVFSTAIIAGVMAAKKTHGLIPFCHPIGLDDCELNINLDESGAAIVNCICKVEHRTGVEMEAMVGASIAALTIYDMCKALSHNIIIKETVLISKTGGKATYYREN